MVVVVVVAEWLYCRGSILLGSDGGGGNAFLVDDDNMIGLVYLFELYCDII